MSSEPLVPTPPSFINPEEWNRRVDLHCTGMSIHTARQVLMGMFMLWDMAELRAGLWGDEEITLYIVCQVRLRGILARENLLK